MRIGIDFDNTIVCFDPLFLSAARQKKLIPAKAPLSKKGIHDWLHAEKKNDEWTRLQGIVYGQLIAKAEPFPGVSDFFAKAREKGHELLIISHKTAKSALSPFTDLHGPAYAWLTAHEFTEKAFFEPTQEQKIKRIAAMKCDVVIDDLLEFLERPDFPSSVRKILFDPHNEHKKVSFERETSWQGLARLLL